MDNISSELFEKDNTMNIYYNDGELAALEIYKVKKSSLDNCLETLKDPFSLILKGSRNIFFNQGYYDFEHKNIGKLELFMVPIIGAAGDNDSYYYEISFV